MYCKGLVIYAVEIMCDFYDFMLKYLCGIEGTPKQDLRKYKTRKVGERRNTG